MTASDTHLLLRALVDELVRCGMRTAVTSPGSRNTPVIEALVAEARLNTYSSLDERSAGFFAVGVARASGLPVAVTVTSGTAVANLLPAVIEASEGGLPLIVLSADRPAELRGVGAGQTIDQVKIFGGAVRLYAEPDLSEASPARLRWIRSLACRVFLTAAGEDPGPVHLNLALREPLVLEGPLPAIVPGGEGRADGRPWVRQQRRATAQELGGPTELSSAPRPGGPPASGPPQALEAAAGSAGPRTVIVAGLLDGGPQHHRLGAELAAAAAAAGIPLLADPLSGARRGPATIAHYDLILRHGALAGQLTPDEVIRLGDVPTSKPLRAWLAGLGPGVLQTAYTRRPLWPDPDATMATITRFSDISELHLTPQPAGWLARWRAADLAAARAIAEIVDADADLDEPTLAATLVRELPAAATLFVAASMPIRDLEEFAAPRPDPPRILANRGANGIDGTVSAALGTAAVSDGPVVLLTGDVALLHDIGGLLGIRRQRLKLTVVLVNNDGGGIFNFLAIADPAHAAAFEEHVATPHGSDLGHAAALYGLAHVTVSDVGGIIAALDQSLSGDDSTLIEIRTNRTANRALHAQIASAADEHLRRVAREPAP